MINIRNRDNLFFPGMEPWQGILNKKKLELLQTSWAGIFKKHIVSSLPIKEVSAHFCDDNGRPTKELITVIGSCVLQQMFDLTDIETRDQLAFNEQWHFALDTFNPDEQVISLKTLWNVRNILVSDELANRTFKESTDKLADFYDVDTSFQRLDSVHIHSNMARLGRVRLLSRVITNFLKNLKRHHNELYEDESLSEIVGRYEKEEDTNYFGNVEPSGSKKRLEQVAEDLHSLLSLFSGNEEVTSMYSYKSMDRVFSEQCRLEEGQVVVKAAKEVPSDSLQNPSDPDATYDGHKGQGYQVQLMETYNEKSANEDQTPQLNLITHVEVEPAHNHDSAALKPALEDVKERGLLPEQLTADTSYGSEDNRQKASDRGVELISPVPGRKPERDFSSFKINAETNEIEECIEEHKPETIKHNKKGSITAIWSEEKCNHCARQDSCPSQKGKKGYRLNYKKGEVQTALHRQYEQSEEFKEKYRYRSGIEATNSRYINMTGARRLRYRGLLSVDYAASLKALGINIFRSVRYTVAHGISPPIYTKVAVNYT